MAAKSNLKNMLLCLTGVCLICSAILGVVYVITEEPIAQASIKATNASIAKVLPDGGELSEEKTFEGHQYYTLIRDGKVVAYAVKSSSNGFGGPVTLMVGILPDGTVYNTSVLSHSETPGLGAKCTSDEHFMSQFRNFTSDKVLKVKKDGGDIDAITGSTITSRAYVNAVSEAIKIVESLEKR